MKLRTAIILAAMFPLLVDPLASPGAETLTVTATRLTGSESVTVTGSAPSQQRLEASMYARFSKDLPTVLLSRWYFSSDADGHYNATLPTSPAFFRHAIVTVVVHTLPSGPNASADVIVRAPNPPAEADELPPGFR
ncbi:MAG: hypothetical protein ACRENA_16535 [Vulcanimicrobiaceae bacterium]